jgi:hypothetical protein
MVMGGVVADQALVALDLEARVIEVVDGFAASEAATGAPKERNG